MLHEVVAEAPCSSANLGAGFDVFGLALARYHDRVRVSLTRREKIRIKVHGSFAPGISSKPDRNAAGPPAHVLLKTAGQSKGLDILIEKNVPQGLGLGSSGATAAAVTKALDKLLGLALPTKELVNIASLGEKAVAGNAHKDNVAASLLGGFVIVYGQPATIVSLKPPSNLSCVVAMPQIQIKPGKTKKARRLVPRVVELQKAVLNIGRASAIATGFAKGDIEMIGSGMTDEIAEPARQQLLPSYPVVKKATLEAGAAGVSISGAGPSIIALVDRKRSNPVRIASLMKQAFTSQHVHSKVFTTFPDTGAKILSVK